jgi:hypothetical protein
MDGFEWVAYKVNKILASKELTHLQFGHHQLVVGRHFFDTLVL